MRIDGRELANVDAEREGQRLVIGLDDQATLTAGDTLVVGIG